MYTEVANANPDFAPGYYYLALLHRRMNQPQKAIEEYKKAVEKDDSFLPAINNLAYMYAEYGGDLDEAIRIIQPLAEKYSNEPPLQDTLGWILYKKGQFREALDVVNRVPENVREQVPEALYHRGVILFHVGDSSQAKVELRKALEKTSDPEKQKEIRDLLARLESAA
jgi:tetratricopeptide (TPR) repeat protein